MKAIWNDHVIAESDDTVYVEGNHYFPMNAVNQEVLVHSDRTSFCPWKGIANYFNVAINGDENPDAAWYYPEPKEAVMQIAGRIAFWRGVQVVR